MSALALLRWGLPALIFVVGVVIFIVRGGDNAAIHLVAMTTGAALSVLLVGWLVRIGNSGDRERIAEDEAREYYAAHGRWPDDS